MEVTHAKQGRCRFRRRRRAPDGSDGDHPSSAAASGGGSFRRLPLPPLPTSLAGWGQRRDAGGGGAPLQQGRGRDGGGGGGGGARPSRDADERAAADALLRTTGADGDGGDDGAFAALALRGRRAFALRAARDAGNSVGGGEIPAAVLVLRATYMQAAGLCGSLAALRDLESAWATEASCVPARAISVLLASLPERWLASAERLLPGGHVAMLAGRLRASRSREGSREERTAAPAPAPALEAAPAPATHRLSGGWTAADLEMSGGYEGGLDGSADSAEWRSSPDGADRATPPAADGAAAAAAARRRPSFSLQTSARSTAATSGCSRRATASPSRWSYC